jgi:iron(III) transport system permease protein
VSRWRSGRPGYSPLLAFVALATAAAVGAPLVYIVIRALGAGPERLWAAIASPLAIGLMGRTLALVVGVVALSAVIALPMAWLVSRTDLPFRRAWAVMGALPLVFPSYVAALALVATLGPRGYVSVWLESWLPIEVGNLVYGYSGALLALSLFTYPYVFLLLVAALRDLDPALEEGSRSLGVGRLRTFGGVVLPQLRPALYAGSLLVALYTISDFGAVSIARYNTFTLAIYNSYRALFDRSVAAALALVLVLLAAALIGGEAWLSRRLPPHRVRPSRAAEPVPLGRWRWPALLGLSAIAGLNLVLPTGVLLFWGGRAIRLGMPLESAWSPAVGSLGVSVTAAIVAAALSVPIVVWGARYPSRLSLGVARLSSAGFALPGIVIALALVFFVTRYLLPLYQTLGLLIGAYVIRFLPEALAATRAAFSSLSPRFEEAARSLGSGQLETLRTLTLPLVRPGLLAGVGLVFLTAMKELPATLILRPTGFETLATRIWSTAAEGIYSQAALPGLLLVSVALAPTYLLVIRPALSTGGRPSPGVAAQDR